MEMPSRRHRLLPLILSLALLGCGLGRTPLVLDESLKPAEIDEVLVLPVIDARPAPFDQVQVARNVGDAMVRYLRERGYFTLAADRFGRRPEGRFDLHVATAADLSALAPDDAKYFVLVQVERLEPGKDPNVPAYEASLSAVMVDRRRGRVVWRDVATASSSLTGMLTVFSRGSRQYEAAVNASRALVETLPDKTVRR